MLKLVGKVRAVTRQLSETGKSEEIYCSIDVLLDRAKRDDIAEARLQQLTPQLLGKEVTIYA